MALVAFTGFDNFNTLAQLEAWFGSGVYGTGDRTISSSGGRFGGVAYQYRDTTAPVRNVPGYATYFWGLALAYQQAPTGNGGRILFFQEGGTSHVSISITFNGEIIAWRGNVGGTELGRSDSGVILGTDVWQRLTAQVTVHDTTGVVKVWVGETLVLDLSGQDTRNGGTGVIDGLGFDTCESSNTEYMLIDDPVINDDQGTANTGFLGDVGIESIVPTADSSVQWTPSGGGTNFDEVDETQNDGDTTYVNTATTNFKDLYTMSNITRSFPTVLAVGVAAIAKKEDAGSRTLDLIAKSGVTEGAVNQTLETSYLEVMGIFETNPDTGSAWTPAEVDGMEAGFEAK